MRKRERERGEKQKVKQNKRDSPMGGLNPDSSDRQLVSRCIILNSAHQQVQTDTSLV